MKTKFYVFMSQKSWIKHTFLTPCWVTDTNISFSKDMQVVLPISETMYKVINACIDYSKKEEPVQHVNLDLNYESKNKKNW